MAETENKGKKQPNTAETENKKGRPFLAETEDAERKGGIKQGD